MEFKDKMERGTCKNDDRNFLDVILTYFYFYV